MAKAPAFQFYVRDWLSDPLLRQATPLSRGIWIDVLCFMWEADQRGKLETTPLKLSRMASASIDEVNHFLNELVDLEFGDILTENTPPFPITTQFCNEYVTIINRRMYADHKGKENTRLRVKKHRRKKVCNDDVTPEKQKCNADVTPLSSSSSSSSSSKIKRSPSGDYLKNENDPLVKSIAASCISILQIPIPINSKPFNPYQFVNWALKPEDKNGNKKKLYAVGTVDYALKGLIGVSVISNIKDMWGYANKILISSDARFRELEHIRDHEKRTRETIEFLDNFPELQQLLRETF